MPEVFVLKVAVLCLDFCCLGNPALFYNKNNKMSERFCVRLARVIGLVKSHFGTLEYLYQFQ